MYLKDLCCVLLMMTLAATCIQAQSKVKVKEERLPAKMANRRIATLVVDDAPSVGRVFQQPKVIYRKIAKKSYTPARPTYGPRRTKYGPPRSLKKPGKKHRSKNGSKPHFPYPYKKRAPNPRYGPPKRSTMKPVYGPPKKNNRIYSGIGFGEPPANYNTGKRYRPPKPSEHTRTQKPEFTHEISAKPHTLDFSSPATFNDNFSNGPHNEDFWSQQQFESASSHLGYGEPPVDSYGAPIKANLRDLTYSTAQSFLEPTSHLDEDHNFGPESRPWNNFKDNPDSSFAYSKKEQTLSEAEEPENIFITPVPEKQAQNQELHLNSYSDIYNFRQEEKAKQDKKKKKSFYQKNVKMINRPWVGPKMKEEPEEDVIVGGQYAEPPARHIAKFESSAPLFGDDGGYPAFIQVNDHSDMSEPISSYVNYKNSNMAFSPQNLNDVFSIVDK